MLLRVILICCLFSAGVALVLYSVEMPEYVDANAYWTAIGKIEIGDSDTWYETRAEYLTPKFRLWDYGVSAIVSAVMLALTGFPTLTPPKALSSTLIVMSVVVLPISTGVAGAYGVYRSFERYDYPHWADSLSIPLMGLAIFTILFFGFVLSMVYLFWPHSKSSVPITMDRLRLGPKWLLIMIAMTGFLVLYSFVRGEWLSWIPLFFLLYLFLSLAVRTTQEEMSTRVTKAILEAGQTPTKKRPPWQID